MKSGIVDYELEIALVLLVAAADIAVQWGSLPSDSAKAAKQLVTLLKSNGPVPHLNGLGMGQDRFTMRITEERGSEMKITTLGVDLAKNVFNSML